MCSISQFSDWVCARDAAGDAEAVERLAAARLRAEEAKRAIAARLATKGSSALLVDDAVARMRDAGREVPTMRAARATSCACGNDIPANGGRICIECCKPLCVACCAAKCKFRRHAMCFRCALTALGLDLSDRDDAFAEIVDAAPGLMRLALAEAPPGTVNAMNSALHSTALSACIARGNEGAALACIAAGADPDIQDAYGMTATELASAKHSRILRSVKRPVRVDSCTPKCL